MFSRRTFFILFLAAAAACTPSFQSASDVNDLRVLAVQADPPEAQYDATSADPIHLRILAVDPPRAGGLANMAWSICAPTDTRRCDDPRYTLSLGRTSRQGGAEFSTTVSGALM